MQHIYKKPFYQHSKEEGYMREPIQQQAAAEILEINLNQARPLPPPQPPVPCALSLSLRGKLLLVLYSVSPLARPMVPRWLRTQG